MSYSDIESYSDYGYSEEYPGDDGYSSVESGGYSSEEVFYGDGECSWGESDEAAGACVEDISDEEYSSEEVYGDGECSLEESDEECAGVDDVSDEEDGGAYDSGESDEEGIYVGEYDETDEEDGGGYESEDCGVEVINPNYGSYGYEQISKYHYNDYESGKTYSGKHTEGFKTERINSLIKEEAKYTSQYKVDDVIRGIKTEYETQVKTTTRVTSTSGGSYDSKYAGGFDGIKYSGGSYGGKGSGGSSKALQW